MVLGRAATRPTRSSATTSRTHGGCGESMRRPPIRKTASAITSCDGAATVNPDARHQGRTLVRATGPGASTSRSRSDSRAAGRGVDDGDWHRALDERSRARPTISSRPDAGTADRRRSNGATAGLCGAVVVQAVLPLRRRTLARRRSRRGRRPRKPARSGRNSTWRHLNNHDIISMPDKWEYPWYAAWDLAFHCVVLAHVDPSSPRATRLLCREWYMHPNGQLPAYEWSLGDVNPPVHAWAALRVFAIDGSTDHQFPRAHLPEAAAQLHLVGQSQRPRGQQRIRRRLPRSRQHRPDRSLRALPVAGRLEQSDGTAWMALYCLDMLQIAIVLAEQDVAYEDMATKFFEHFAYIADAIARERSLGRRGRLLLRRVATRWRCPYPAEGAVVGRRLCRSPRPRHSPTPCSSACPGSPSTPAGSSRIGRTSRWTPPACGRSTASNRGCWPSLRPNGCAGYWSTCSTKTGCCRPMAFGRYRLATASTRSRSTWPECARSSTTNPRSRPADCSVAIRTGVARSGFRSTMSSSRPWGATPASSATSSASSVLRVRASCSLDEVAHELGRRLLSLFLDDDHGRRARSGQRQVPERQALARSIAVLRILRRRHRQRTRRVASNWMDRPRRRSDHPSPHQLDDMMRPAVRSATSSTHRAPILSRCRWRQHPCDRFPE